MLTPERRALLKRGEAGGPPLAFACRLRRFGLGARGRPAPPDARRIVAALGRGSLLWVSDKCGGLEHVSFKQS